MDDCRCTQGSEIALLQANQKINIEEVRNLRIEMADLKNIYKLIYELSSNFAVLNETMNRTREDVAYIKSDMEIMKGKPNERENHYIKVGFGAIIAIVVGAIFSIIMK